MTRHDVGCWCRNVPEDFYRALTKVLHTPDCDRIHSHDWPIEVES
jgi:6-pyruvoyl-tetrahydropterin synthase